MTAKVYLWNNERRVQLIRRINTALKVFWLAFATVQIVAAFHTAVFPGIILYLSAAASVLRFLDALKQRHEFDQGMLEGKAMEVKYSRPPWNPPRK